MVQVIKMIKDFFSKKEKNNLESSHLTLEIKWEDLTIGASILVNAMKRNGIYGYPTSNLLILEDGSEYVPLELSDHWEAYINSPKFKPKNINYILKS